MKETLRTPDKFLSGKTVLLTGAGGSIGSAVAKVLASSSLNHLLLIDHSEQNLIHIDLELASMPEHCPHTSVIGDSGNPLLLSDIFQRFRPEVVYHAAAFKQVPLMESNPIAAMVNNAIGTNTLARSARIHRVPHLTMVSTDKAVNPISVMGASKRIAEIALKYWSNSECVMRSIRLGNVVGTQGSVVPRFQRQIAEGGPVTVTHPEATRYFLSLDDAVDLILRVSEFGESGIFIPELGKPITILELAQHMLKIAGINADSSIKFIGLRPGDKMTEQLISESDSIESTIDPNIFRVKDHSVAKPTFEIEMNELARNSEHRDISALLETVGKIVPEYRPSAAVLGIREGYSVRTA